MVHEEEVKELSSYNPDKDLLFHVMAYVSLSQIIKHWTPNTNNKNETMNVIEEHYECLIGDKKDLFDKEKFPTKTKQEHLLLYMSDMDRINSNMKLDTTLKSMNLLYDYILRKRLSKPALIAKNEKDLREIFYHICDLLEK